MKNEAHARIKINQLLSEADWRFFDNEQGEYYVFRPNEKILSTWIYLNIITDSFRKNGKLNMTGTGGLQRVPTDFVKSYQIAVPPVETQQQIVTKVENEQKLIASSKELIAIYEQKIKDRISKVWGN